MVTAVTTDNTLLTGAPAVSLRAMDNSKKMRFGAHGTFYNEWCRILRSSYIYSVAQVVQWVPSTTSDSKIDSTNSGRGVSHVCVLGVESEYCCCVRIGQGKKLVNGTRHKIQNSTKERKEKAEPYSRSNMQEGTAEG